MVFFLLLIRTFNQYKCWTIYQLCSQVTHQETFQVFSQLKKENMFLFLIQDDVQRICKLWEITDNNSTKWRISSTCCLPLQSTLMTFSYCAWRHFIRIQKKDLNFYLESGSVYMFKQKPVWQQQTHSFSVCSVSSVCSLKLCFVKNDR